MLERRPPTPRSLYVHDDLSDLLGACGESSPARRLGHALLARLRAEPSRIIVLTEAAQVEALIARGAHVPFEVAVGIGAAGVRVAAHVHERTGWFPVVRQVDVWREETDDGGYVLGAAATLAARLRELPDVARLAIVDDTIFSGFTIRAVLSALPSDRRPRVQVFCLRAVADTLADLAALVPVTAGVAAPGRLLTDVSFVNASGLVRRGAIRRVGQPPLAFYERPEWMAAWFPEDHAEVTTLCRDLCAALESERPARRGASS
jgi:hypothetical protein